MRLRSFALLALATAGLAGCLSSSIIDTSSSACSASGLPALENTPYDSLGGHRLAWQRFATTAGSFRGVYVLDGVARRVQTILTCRAIDRSAMSPIDGRLLYGGQTTSGASIFDIYTTRLTDSVETQITSGTEIEQYPSWSADGSQMYWAYRGNGKTILVRQNVATAARDTMVLADSQTVQWIVDSPVQVNAAGRALLVTHSAGWRISAFDWSTGANRVKLREDTRNDIGPIIQGASWSPDGTKIAWLQLNYDAADQLNSTTLKIMNADGSNEVSIVTVNTLPFTWQATALNDFSVCWLDASRIAFNALGNDRASHVYVARFGTGTTLTQVTSNSGVFDRGVSCR